MFLSLDTMGLRVHMGAFRVEVEGFGVSVMLLRVHAESFRVHTEPLHLSTEGLWVHTMLLGVHMEPFPQAQELLSRAVLWSNRRLFAVIRDLALS